MTLPSRTYVHIITILLRCCILSNSFLVLIAVIAEMITANQLLVDFMRVVLLM